MDESENTFPMDITDPSLVRGASGRRAIWS